MFSDEMASQRVKATRQERGENKVIEGVPGAGADENVVECNLNEDIDKVDAGEGYLIDEDGADSIEENLKGAEKGFAKEGIKEDCFEGGGQIGVEAVNTEGLVVSEVVRSERSTIGYSNR
jgi:hypothetical protein